MTELELIEYTEKHIDKMRKANGLQGKSEELEKYIQEKRRVRRKLLKQDIDKIGKEIAAELQLAIDKAIK
jgi:hypothetical protein